MFWVLNVLAASSCWRGNNEWYEPGRYALESQFILFSFRGQPVVMFVGLCNHYDDWRRDYWTTSQFALSELKLSPASYAAAKRYKSCTWQSNLAWARMEDYGSIGHKCSYVSSKPDVLLLAQRASGLLDRTLRSVLGMVRTYVRLCVCVCVCVCLLVPCYRHVPVTRFLSLLF